MGVYLVRPLRFPLPLESIQFEGAGLKSAQLWVSTLHPSDRYDELVWHELKADTSNTFTLPPALAGRSVAEIRFRCDVAGSDRRLQLKLARPADATERP